MTRAPTTFTSAPRRRTSAWRRRSTAYLAAIDSSASVAAHVIGERQFIERYVAQRSQRAMWQTTSVAGALLALVLGLVFITTGAWRTGWPPATSRCSSNSRPSRRPTRRWSSKNLSDTLTGLPEPARLRPGLAASMHASSARPAAEPAAAGRGSLQGRERRLWPAPSGTTTCAVAQVLRKVVTRSTDLAAPRGENSCLLPDTSATQAQALAERIREATQQLTCPTPAPGTPC